MKRISSESVRSVATAAISTPFALLLLAASALAGDRDFCNKGALHPGSAVNCNNTSSSSSSHSSSSATGGTGVGIGKGGEANSSSTSHGGKGEVNLAPGSVAPSATINQGAQSTLVLPSAAQALATPGNPNELRVRWGFSDGTFRELSIPQEANSAGFALYVVSFSSSTVKTTEKGWKELSSFIAKAEARQAEIDLVSQLPKGTGMPPAIQTALQQAMTRSNAIKVLGSDEYLRTLQSAASTVGAPKYDALTLMEIRSTRQALESKRALTKNPNDRLVFNPLIEELRILEVKTQEGENTSGRFSALKVEAAKLIN